MTNRLSRRAFLGGAGAMLALPFLESLIPPRAMAQAMGKPRRFLTFYVPNGIHMAGWTPAAEGRDFELSPILSPLSNVRDKIMVLTGLNNIPARPDGPGDHASGTGGFLTARHVVKTEGEDIRNGVSLDQLAAASIGGLTRFPSLQLGIDGGGSVGNCDSGYSCAYSRNISWSGETTPIPKTVNPQVVFDRLFAGFDTGASAAELARRRRYNKSVLDYALGDAQRLQNKLGQTDRRKLDEYMTGVRELETRVSSAQDGPVCDVPNRPPSRLEFPEHVRLMSDLMVLAFQCDMTRIITFMLGNAASSRAYTFLGISSAHHEISHHQNQQENFDALQTIDTWEVAQLAYILEKMDAIDEGNGTTMLDNSCVFFSSEIEDGNSHSHNNLPVLLAGGNGDYFDLGQHISYSNREPIADLFLSILDSLDIQTPTFGDNSTGLLAKVRRA